jgi:hydroxyacylglutathione hydrolase
VDEAIRDLAMIGLDRVGAVFPPSVVEAWAEAGGEIGTVGTRTPGETEAALLAGQATVVDVRGTAEWREGHIDGVPVIPTGHLLDHLDELPRDGELILHCRSGARSAIAASLLQREGFDNVTHMQGGWVAWTARGLPAVREDAGVGAGA